MRYTNFRAKNLNNFLTENSNIFHFQYMTNIAKFKHFLTFQVRLLFHQIVSNAK